MRRITLEKNLFEKAQEAITNFTNRREDSRNQDKQAVRNIIQSAYDEATPEQKKQLQHFEKQLDEENLH